MDALLNSEVEFAAYFNLYGHFGDLATAPSATPQETYDEDVVVDEQDLDMVLCQEAEIQALLRSLRVKSVVINAFYDTEEVV